MPPPPAPGGPGARGAGGGGRGGRGWGGGESEGVGEGYGKGGLHLNSVASVVIKKKIHFENVVPPSLCIFAFSFSS